MISVVEDSVATLSSPSEDSVSETFSLIVPEGVEAGDFAFVVIGSHSPFGEANTITPPPGWFEVINHPDSVYDYTAAAIFCRPTGSYDIGVPFVWTSSGLGGTLWNATIGLIRSDAAGYVATYDTSVSDYSNGSTGPAVTAAGGLLFAVATCFDNQFAIVDDGTFDATILSSQWGLTGQLGTTIWEKQVAAGASPAYAWLLATNQATIINILSTVTFKEIPAVSISPPGLAVFADQDAVGAPIAALQPGVAANIIDPQDVSFASAGTGNWEGTVNVGTLAVVSHATLVAAKCLSVTPTATGDMVIYNTEVFPASQGVQYTFACMSRGAASRPVRVDYRWLDGLGNIIGGWNDGTPVTDNATIDVTPWVTAVAPPGTAGTQIRAYVTGAAEDHLIGSFGIYPAGPGYLLQNITDYDGHYPELYWQLSDTVGSTTAADSSGFGHPGTVVGTVVFGEPSILTAIPAVDCLDLTPGGYISSSWEPPFSSWPGMAVEAVVTVTPGFGAGMTVFQSDGSCDLVTVTGGRVAWIVNDATGAQHTIYSDEPINDGAPHVVNGSVGPAGMRLIVDARPQLDSQPTVTTIHNPTGGINVGPGGGQIQDVTLWPVQPSEDAVYLRKVASLTGEGVQGLSPGTTTSEVTNIYVEIQRSLIGTVDAPDWTDVRNGYALPAGPEGADPIADYEVCPLTPTFYRARITGIDATSGDALLSGWSGTQEIDDAGEGMTQYFVMDPTNPAATVCALDLADDWAKVIHQVGTTFYPLGRATGIKSTDGTKGEWDGTWKFFTTDIPTRNRLRDLLASDVVMLLQSPLGEQGYMMTDPQTDPSEGVGYQALLQVPFFTTTVAVLSASVPPIDG